MKRVWWAFLLERCAYDLAVDAVARVSWTMGKLAERFPEQAWRPLYVAHNDGNRPGWTYMRTDVARQMYCEAFLLRAKDPTDTLVMFDIDHDHTPHIAQQLVGRDVEVCVPLMFRRGEPYQACAFKRAPDGELRHMLQFPPGLWEVDAVGSGVIAIQRQALQKIKDAGLGPWFWRYQYFDDMRAPSEDLYFSELCGRAGVRMWIDTTIETPHIGLGLINRELHDEYLADHPELVTQAIPIRATGLEVEPAN